jgi:hypothetical protein
VTGSADGWATMRVVAAVLALACAGCTANPGGRVYRGPSQDATERDALSKAAAGTGDAVPGDPAGADALPGDAVPGDGVPAGRVVGTPSRPTDPTKRTRRRVDEDQEAFFREKVETARAAIDRGDGALAAELVDGALALEPPPDWEEKLLNLRGEVRARHLETEVIRADVRGVVDYVPFGRDVDLVVRLRNVGTADVVISPPSGKGAQALSGSTLALAVRRRDRDVYAAELVQSWTQSVPLVAEGAPERRIAPEDSLEVRVRVPAAELGPPISGLRVLEVSGDLRAGRIEAGLSEPIGRVRIRTGRVVIVPSGYEPIAADPLGAMRKAAEMVAPVHLLVAAEFVAPADRVGAVTVLADVLAQGSLDLDTAAWNALHHLRAAAVGTPVRPLAAPLMAALLAHPERETRIMQALTALTGVALAPDARLWEDWWRRESSGPGSLVPSDDDLPDATDVVRGR